jgi:demethylmenaquinone methyltransferase/2-methoxy-6-polyprenyl-1,4-benzoquinol methylase
MKPVNSMQTRDGSGEMFDRIATRYDLLNRMMSLGMDRTWRRIATKALELKPCYRILDLATGTADLAIEIASRDATIKVVGLDPSTQMLNVGRRKVNASAYARQIELVEGDAQKLSFGDCSFDGVCMAFGIRNVPNRPQALREMARVVRPGGRICVLELSEPETGFIGSIARFYVHVVVPRLGSWLSGEREYRYLQRSIAAFPSATDFATVMADSGLEVLTIKRLGFGACHLFVASPKHS